MIQFWFKSVFEQPAIQTLDYFCRMDTDSYFLAPVPQNFLKEMHTGQYTYAFRAQTVEGVEVTDGMWDFIDNYLQHHPRVAYLAGENGFTVPSQADRETTSHQQYYNNFEVVHVPTFSKHPDILHFTNAVDRTNNIYNRRWGDAPLRFLTCKLFIPNAEVLEICDIDYEHQYHMPPTCFNAEQDNS